MKKFEDFREYLNKNSVEVDSNMLSALEVYHKWLQTEGARLDGKEVRKALDDEAKRTTGMTFM